MNQHETLREFLTTLYRAEAVVTNNPLEPLHFNGARSLIDYRLQLLNTEYPAIDQLKEIRRLEQKDEILAVAVQETLMELQIIFKEDQGVPAHRFLNISHDGHPVDRKDLNLAEEELLEEYLHLQKSSFLRQKRWFDTPKTSLSFPGTLQGNDTDIAEIMALHLHTSLTFTSINKYRIKEFIQYFCKVWNLSQEKDYYSLISHTLARPHPTAYIEKLTEELQEHIEQLDRKRK